MNEQPATLESAYWRLCGRSAPWQATTAIDTEFQVLAGLARDRELCKELAIDPNELYHESARAILEVIVTIHSTARQVSRNAIRVELERSRAWSDSIDDALQAVAYFLVDQPMDAEQTRLVANRVRRNAWLRQQWMQAAIRAEQAWHGTLGAPSEAQASAEHIPMSS